MRIHRLVILFRLALVVAIVASAILVIEYRSGEALFCGAASDCAKVRSSDAAQWIASVLRVPLPNVGVFAHMALLGASLFASAKVHHRIVAAGAALGALAATTFILLQLFVVHAICTFCVAVDGGAIVAGVCALLIAREVYRDESLVARMAPESSTASIIAWASAGVVATSMPFVWRAYPVEPPAPPAIAALAVPGKLTVVAFTDFECPYCRKQHPVLHDLLERAGDRVALVRVMVPLAFHMGALPAAKAFVCAPPEKSDALAGALYDAPPKDLTKEGVIAIAERLGVQRASFEPCLEAAETAQRVARDKDIYKAVGGAGLPLTYIGGTPVLGFEPEELERTLDRHLTPKPIELPTSWLYVLVGLSFAGAAAVSLASEDRKARRASAPPKKDALEEDRDAPEEEEAPEGKDASGEV